jgi:NTE family protein
VGKGDFKGMDIVLALGGGGVKGYAHIGVMSVLERCGFRVRAIAGTSAGGLFGSLYAAGYRYDDLQELLLNVDQNRLFARLPGDGPALLGLGGVAQMLDELLGERSFADLPVPIAMTGVDLEQGEQIVMDQGRVLDAVLATIALPGLFPPRLWNGRLVIDGGVIDPVPVRLARQMAPGLPVVAVVLTPTTYPWNGHREPPSFLTSVPLISRLYQFRLPQSLNIFLRSVDIAGCYLTEMTLETEQPEIVIRPPLGYVGLVEQVDIMRMIQEGEKAAEEMLPALFSLFQRRAHWTNLVSARLPWLGNILRKTYIDT